MSEALILPGNIALTSDSDRVLRARILSSLTGRLRGVGLALASRTITTQSADISTIGYRGLIAWINIVSIGATGLRLIMRGQDPVSGAWGAIAQSSTQTTTGLFVVSFGPGSSQIGGGGGAPAGGTVGCYLPGTMRLEGSAIGTDSITYSIGYELCA
jgi:hypothetical protein